MGKGHLQPLPESCSYLTQKPKFSPEAPRVICSLTVPHRKTLEAITLAATDDCKSVVRERELNRSLLCALSGPQFPLLYLMGASGECLLAPTCW